MRCLLLPDDLKSFRPIAMAIRGEPIDFVMLRQFNSARLALHALEFDLVIVGANTTDAPTLRFLKGWKPAKLPALGVTSVPAMCDELTAAGANRVVVLPCQPESLRDTIRVVLDQPAHADC